MWSRIEYGQWKALLSRQRQRVDKLLPTLVTEDENHPIYNFFLTYYRYVPSALRSYSPGIGVMISTESADDYKSDLPKKGRVVYNDSCVIFDPRSANFNEKQVNNFRKTLRILEATKIRPPNFHCYGLHEWAMLYSKSTPFVTQSLPLRKSLSNEVIQEVVKTQGPKCTHYDAFRFFSEDAKPLNSTVPRSASSAKLASEMPLTRENEEHFEQPGCLHSIMDIYRWSLKIFPFISSNLLVDSLELAIKAREVDMRASPYDLKAYEFRSSERVSIEPNHHEKSFENDFDRSPILIETIEGRREYAKLQKELYEQSKPVREQVIMSYKILSDNL